MVDSSEFMRSKKEKLLKGFGKIVADLQLFFRSRNSLTENEQLFIENRLMILQVEYNHWTKRPVKVVRVSKKDTLLRPKAHINLPSREELEDRQSSASKESLGRESSINQPPSAS
jgi:hypothetical protein